MSGTPGGGTGGGAQPTLVVSLNGSRGAADGSAVPMSPEDLVAAALAAVAAGAREVLVHPRTPCGRESLSPRVVGPLLEALREAGLGGGVAVSVPLSIASEPDHAARLARIRSWTVLPDRAVVRFAEPGARELAQALLERGVAVDAEVQAGGAVPAGGNVPADGAAAAGGNRLAGTEPAAGAAGGRAGSVARFLAWPLRDPARVRLVAELGSAGPWVVAELLRRLPPVAVVLFGREEAAWPALRLAARYGTGARIGVGDVLRLPDGRAARSNAELVAAAARAREVTTAGNR
ncbi:3-keto-5-aminohexanoate cleavage protein [Streptomyces sp. TBY4]|uniref:3-keto-5-aminohexanoate cleavage protein n=1 Tax=Streptomyces sp. TBY4 TaxID=2962030 RepID=UPI0020B7D2BD|nr:3-keto-5-aminohexanoate cleavage protein [Streptomyces sp. TBY4]MCP3757553.1 3-keto-5-aminohexanoate cleavage protein [Streptomyces sp. TBY4]